VIPKFNANFRNFNNFHDKSEKGCPIHPRHQLRIVGYQMSAPEWQIAFPTGNWVTTYRGVRIVIARSETGQPLEIGWFIGGQEAESIPLACDEEEAKRIGTEVVDQRTPVDEEWQQAEKKDGESDLS
jgi:hypothetical protein